MQMTTHKFKLHARRNPAVILISRHFLISASLPRNPSCYLVVSMTHQPLCDNLNLRCLLIVPLNDKLKAPLIVVVSNYICLLMLLLFVRPGHDGLFPVWNSPFAYPSIQSRSEKILQPDWPSTSPPTFPIDNFFHFSTLVQQHANVTLHIIPRRFPCQVPHTPLVIQPQRVQLSILMTPFTPLIVLD